MATVRQTNKILKIYKRKGLHIPYCIPLSWNEETAIAFIKRHEQYLESTDSNFATQKQIIKRINRTTQQTYKLLELLTWKGVGNGTKI